MIFSPKQDQIWTSNKENIIDGDVSMAQADRVAEMQVVISALQLNWNDKDAHKKIAHSKGKYKCALKAMRCLISG